MTNVAYDEALIDQNRLLSEALRGADWSTPVPTCPGWTVLQVLRHVGRGDRWSAQIIRDGTGEVDPRQVADGRPPDDSAGAVGWLQAGPRTLLNAVVAAGPEASAWTFVGPRPAEWWIRRRLHEATVHRADVSFALGREYGLDASLAADGISEWLALASVLFAPQETVALRATDGDAQEWSVGQDRPAVTLQGRSVDLLLALTGRTDTSPLDVSGERDVWDRWISGVNF